MTKETQTPSPARKRAAARQVILSVSGSVDGDDGDNVRLMTTGQLSGETDHWKLRYNETMPDSTLSNRITVSMDGDTVTMQREGPFSTALVFQKGRRYESTYDTPFGSLDMGVYATRVHYSVQNGVGEVELQYQLDVQGQFAAMRELSIQFAPGKGKPRKRAPKKPVIPMDQIL